MGENYWVYNLDPYIFQIQHISYSLSSIFCMLFIILASCCSIIFLTKKKILSAHIARLAIGILAYILILYLICFVLQKFHVAGGLRWYSTGIAFGFICIYFAFSYWSKKQVLMFTQSNLPFVMILIVLGVFIGARLVYIFVYMPDFSHKNLLTLIDLRGGGLSFHGGILGIICVGLLYSKVTKVPFFHMTDKGVRIVPIGIALGRFGNFMNGELWGREVSSYVPWAIIFPNAGSVARHPSQLYESLGEGLLLFFTLYLLSRRPRREGVMSAYFIIFYCIYRFFIEYFRAADAQLNYFYLNHFAWASLDAYQSTAWWKILTTGQILCVVFCTICLIALKLFKNNILENSPEWIARNKVFFDKRSDTPNQEKVLIV